MVVYIDGVCSNIYCLLFIYCVLFTDSARVVTLSNKSKIVICDYCMYSIFIVHICVVLFIDSTQLFYSGMHVLLFVVATRVVFCTDVYMYYYLLLVHL